MVSDFERAIHDLADEDKPLSVPLLTVFSCTSRAESEVFVRCVRGITLERKRKLVAKMVEMAEASFTLDYMALFRRLLHDDDAVVRRLAVEGLWEDECASLVEPLLKLLASDPDSEVRAAVATSLARFVFIGECEELDEQRTARVRQALERVIESPDETIDVARRAVESIAYINDQGVRRIIDRAYDSDDSRLRESAVFAMGRSADPFWAEIVLTELQDGSPSMRYEAARASGEMQLKRAVTSLIKLVADPDREVQGMAVWALGQIGGKRAQAVLQEWAGSDDDVLAEAAAAALEEIGFANTPLDLLVYNPNNEAEDESVGEEDEDEFDLGDDEDDDAEWDDEPLDLN